MKKLISFILSVSIASSVYAGCNSFGSGNFKTTYCDDGSTYDTQKFGNTTYTNGNNARTGSSWSSTSTRYGNTLDTTGRNSDGETWRSTTHYYDSFSTTDSTDSKGNSKSTFNLYER